MRILYVTPYPPARDGIGDYAERLVRAVRGRGHEVRVIAARPADGPAPPEVMAALPRAPVERDALVERLAGWRPDVVHVQFAVAAFSTRLPALVGLLRALRPLGARVVVTLHEVTRDTASLRGPGRAVYRRVAGGADLSLVHTGIALDELTRRVGVTPERAALVPHPHTELPAASVAPGELRERHGLAAAPVLLAFGFIHVDKGLDDLVAALAQMRERAARLVVAGDVRPRHGLFRAFERRDRVHLALVRRQIARAGLDDRVAFTGYVPAGEIRPWLELAEAAVLPYRRIEQSGVASLAAAAGTPVLVSDAGGLADGLGTRRFGFPARDPRALAAALDDFLAASPAERDRARLRPEGADMDAVVDATVAHYAAAARAPTPIPTERRVPQHA